MKMIRRLLEVVCWLGLLILGFGLIALLNNNNMILLMCSYMFVGLIIGSICYISGHYVGAKIKKETDVLKGLEEDDDPLQ